MKNIFQKETITYLLVLTCLSLLRCTTPELKETSSPLESRLDSLLNQMSMQDKIEQLYYNTDGNERLGIPQFTGSDGPHGIGNNAKGFSCFPVTIAMAATWDNGLITKVGRAIALEQAARGRDRIAGPTLDLLIDPRIGRAPETFGEDPYLGGRISEAFVKGQNTTSVFGTIKHYNLNTYEINRRTNNYLSDKRSLVEFWGAHWKRTIQQGGAISVMCAYNWINGDKCAENKYMIKDLLRDHWGFDYYVMCDWGGFSSTEKALNSELDFCEGNDLYIKELPEGVKSGRFDSTLVERAARNVLRTKIVSGMMDGKPVTPASVIDCKEHRELVYESGLKSLVLLKNEDRVLPFNKEEIKKLAIIGPNAAKLPLDGHSSSNVTPSYSISVKDGIEKEIGSQAVLYAKGCNVNDNHKEQFAEAIEAAKAAQCVVFVGGLDDTVEGEGYFINPDADEKGGGAVTRPDRASQTVVLPGVQNELIKELAKVNPNIILVVISGGTCSVTPVINDIKGLLYAFYPGQEGGRAIADVLFGKYNPSGKMPATMPKGDEQIFPINPDFRDLVTRGVGYRWFDAQKLEPEFAFGAGLSYTTFEYTNIRINKTQGKVGDVIIVTCDLTNIGEQAGAEVAQLYLSAKDIQPDVMMPVKQLRGYQKVSLQPGETKIVSFELHPDDFYIYNEQKAAYQVPAGEYNVMIGGASDNLSLDSSFSLLEGEEQPDLQLVNIRTIPAFPTEGDEVIFMASLINNGTAASNIGDAHTVQFYVDGQEAAIFHSKSLSIPSGGMKVICAQGINDRLWQARTGVFTIDAVIGVNEKDLHTSNNRCQAHLSIPGGRAISTEMQSLIE